MKRLVAVVCSTLLFAGCAGAGGSGTAPAAGGSSAANLDAVNSSELASYISREEVTPENWENFFTAEVEHNVKLDAFGEDVGEYEEGVALRLKDNYIAGDDLVMRFEVQSTTTSEYVDRESGEVVEPQWEMSPRVRLNQVDVIGSNIGGYNNPYYMVDYVSAYRNSGTDVNGDGIQEAEKPHYELNSLAMTKSIGSVVLFDLPEDKWMTDENGVKFLRILNEETGNYGEYYMNGATKMISKNGEVLSYNKAKKNAPEYTINQLFNGRWGLGSYLEVDE